eukprot:749855-Hanusia_phi.AAC.1
MEPLVSLKSTCEFRSHKFRSSAVEQVAALSSSERAAHTGLRHSGRPPGSAELRQTLTRRNFLADTELSNRTP